MRNSLCWTVTWKPGSADDRLRPAMTTPVGREGRSSNDGNCGGKSRRDGETGPGGHAVPDDTDDDDDAPLVLTGRLWPTFAARTVLLPPGSALPFAEADWTDALIVIESGELEVETVSGLRRQFGTGEILWFAGLDLRVLRSCGIEPTVLKAVSRGRRD